MDRPFMNAFLLWPLLLLLPVLSHTQQPKDYKLDKMRR